MRFSIIIPARNEVESFQRTWRQFVAIDPSFSREIIVADDMSTDNTMKFAARFATRVLPKVKGEAKTISAVRNRAARVASGDILLFLDAGVVIPDINRFLRLIDETFKTPRVQGATVRLEIYPDQARWSDRFWHAIFNAFIKWWNIFGWGAAVGKVHAIRAESFRHIGGYNESLAAGEDNDLFQRLNRLGRTVFIGGLTVYYSPRRFRNYGYTKTIALWLLNIVYIKFFRRSFNSSWKRVN